MSYLHVNETVASSQIDGKRSSHISLLHSSHPICNLYDLS